jgi:hypothetical protein
MPIKKARFTAHVMLTLEVPAIPRGSIVADPALAARIGKALDNYLDELRGQDLILFRALMSTGPGADTVGVRLAGAEVTNAYVGSPGDQDESEDDEPAKRQEPDVPALAPYDQHIARMAMMEYVKGLSLDTEPLNEEEASRVAAHSIRLGQIYAHYAMRRPIYSPYARRTRS